MLAPVGLQPVERDPHVLHERAPADRIAAVPVGHGAHRHVGLGDVDARQRRAGRRAVRERREDRVDGRRQAAREERGHPDRQQQVDGRPVAAADRPVALEVVDRRGREQPSLVAVERDEDRAQVAMQREAVAHREQRVHVPAEAQRPGVLGDRLVHRGVAVHGHDLEVGVDLVAPALRPRALAEPVEQVDERRRAVQPDAAVADEMAERGDALDVVADVRRRAVGAGVAVVDHRERAPPAFRRRGGRRVRVGRDPRRASSRGGSRPASTAPGPAPDGARSARTPRARARRRRSRTWRSRTSYQALARTSGGSSATSARTSASASAGATARPERTYSAAASRAHSGRGTRRSSSQASSTKPRRKATMPPHTWPTTCVSGCRRSDSASDCAASWRPAADERARLRHERLLDRLAALQRAQQRRVRHGGAAAPAAGACAARLRAAAARARRGSAPEAGERRRRRAAQRAQRLASGRGQPAREAPGGATRPSHGRRAASRGARAGSRRGP